MNQRSDTDRLLRHWMTDGPSTMSDRVVDVVADRISRQPQRRSWRLPWRLPMTSQLKLAAGTAAVLALAVAGYSLLPKTGLGPGATPSIPAPSVTAGPSSVPIGSSPPVLSNGALPAGRYQFGPFIDPSLTITADVPAGWIGHPPTLVTWPDDDDPANIATAFLLANRLHGDPCHWDRIGDGNRGQPGDVPVGPTALDLVNALRSISAYTTTEPTPLTIGAHRGYALGIRLPDGLDLDTCDGGLVGGSHYYQVFSGPYSNPLFQGRGNVIDVAILDVDGTRVIAMIRYSDDTPAADVDAARGIVESAEFTP